MKTYKLILALVITLFPLHTWGAGSIVVSNTKTLDSILASTPAAGTTIVIPNGASAASRTLSASVDRSLPDGCSLQISPGVPVIIPTGRSFGVCWGASILAGQNYQVFSCQGTGRVIYTQNSPVPVKWFGAKGDDSTDDTVAIQKAFDAVGRDSAGNPRAQWSGAVLFTNGSYITTKTVYFYTGMTILGNGTQNSRIANNGNTATSTLQAYESDSDHFGGFVTIKDITIMGPTNATAGAAIDMAANQIPGGSSNSRHSVIENVNISSHYDGIRICDFTVGSLRNIECTGCLNNGIVQYNNGDWNAVTLYNCYTKQCGRHGYNIGPTYSSLISCAADSNRGDGYHFYNSVNNTMVACGAEANTGTGLYVGDSKNNSGYMNILGFYCVPGVNSIWLDGTQCVFISGFHDGPSPSENSLKITANSGTGRQPWNIMVMSSYYNGSKSDPSGVVTEFQANSFKTKLNISSVPDYANNAAALAGGLVTGDVYRITGSDNLAIVH